jgi:hypothetical protein
MLPNLGIFPNYAVVQAAFKRLLMRSQYATVRPMSPLKDNRRALAHTFRICFPPPICLPSLLHYH